ncbi:MAG: hypothetical protein JXA82_12840 [Sedimentisphaerales bacterium]|nr:hypothetical protein [Sedimentisphaerales bacterium]
MVIKTQILSVLLAICTCLQAGWAMDPWYWSDGQTVDRVIPTPMEEHPGNIYLETETVWVKTPQKMPEKPRSWRLLDDRGKMIRSGVFSDEKDVIPSRIQIGQLEVGWYRIEFLVEDRRCINWTTCAVLKKLAAATPQDSPVCVDSATAWFAKDKPADQARLASLAALAGINWVRDRLTWRELEPRQGELVRERTTYDSSAEIQTLYGLKVLQVFHTTPGWAWNEELDGDHPSGRFARDLRHVFRFCKAISQRFKGRVHAWEPWNEANVSVFGGHTVDEMCSFQKAAYLGFKEGDPDVIVGWNVYTTVPTPRHTEGLLENEVWSYFDTYNIHTYEWAHGFDTLWAPARDAACGKPIWVTEADRGVKYVGPEPWCELSREDEMHKARYIAQSYASSLYAGSTRHFHFILGHYYETNNGVQFGLLRKDMTPRPAYVALAAVGRLLAGAKCLGRWDRLDQPDINLFVFRARPDGVERDVLVAWAEKKVDWAERNKTDVEFSLPQSWGEYAVYDYLGRELEKIPNELTGEVIFIVLPAGVTRSLQLSTLKLAEKREEHVCPVVMQVQIPRENSMKIAPLPWSQGFEYRIDPDKVFEGNVLAYNFSNKEVQGTVRIAGKPMDWAIKPSQWDLNIESLGQVSFTIKLSIPAGQDGSIKLIGDFGPAGNTVLAFRMHGKEKQHEQ